MVPRFARDDRSASVTVHHRARLARPPPARRRCTARPRSIRTSTHSVTQHTALRLAHATAATLLVSRFRRAPSCLPAQSPFDLVIRNGRIVDGTGSPWYSGDVGIRGGGSRRSAGSTAPRRSGRWMPAGKVVAPGFIDMLGQSELTILVESEPAVEDLPGHHHRDHRGGGSPAPLDDAIVAADQTGLRPARHQAGLADAGRSTSPGSSGRA